jgi:hypothetical protein
MLMHHPSLSLLQQVITVTISRPGGRAKNPSPEVQQNINAALPKSTNSFFKPI